MSMEYIRRTYGVPARRGALIEHNPDGINFTGRIVGSKGAYLRVRMDGATRIWTLHPTWRVEYLKTPNVRVKPAPTVGRQARDAENVRRTCIPGMVARRWGSA